MSLKMSRSPLLFIAALLLLIGSIYMQNLNAEDSVEQVRKSYQEAGSDKERMRVVIKAIDDGIICQGCKLAVIDGIFGTTFMDDPLSPFDPFTKGEVRFSEQIQSPDSAVQAPLAGWYLGFEYDSNRTIVSYCLSNTTK